MTRLSGRRRLSAGLRLLVALAFALWAPLAAGNAAWAAGAAAKAEVAMPCHGDGGRADSHDMVNHACCFTACLPLGVVADAAPMAAPARAASPFAPVRATVSLTRGVDPPPPRP
ncbi:MAG: hypothetical protein IPK81_09015 [Rhodospirillales bacterium]|nr:MAG: hypothetical protein IPK81_09015 [Rhodospirillales bacterium]